MRPIAEIEEELRLAKAQQDVKIIKNYRKAQESRERAKKKFEGLIPKITNWVDKNLKPGDIIQCKGYRGVKKVVDVRDYVYAICGWMRKGEFIPNGSGSSTTIHYVTHILKDGKFIKIIDLI